MSNWPPKLPALQCPGCGCEINTEEHRGDCVWQAAIRERQERHRISALRHRTERADLAAAGATPEPEGPSPEEDD